MCLTASFQNGIVIPSAKLCLVRMFMYDLPTLLNSSKENVSIKFQEESDDFQMKMNIRTTVNVHKDIYFNNMAEIIVVRFKSMS